MTTQEIEEQLKECKLRIRSLEKMLYMTYGIDAEAIRGKVIKKIARYVSDEHKIRLDLIMSRSRKAEVVEARHLAFWIIRSNDKATISLQEIAEYFKRNHASVIHGIKSIENTISTNQLKGITYLSLKKRCDAHISLAIPFDFNNAYQEIYGESIEKQDI
jgi:chromosomal replication initiation ATPase DnaA